MGDELLYNIKNMSYAYLERFPALQGININIIKGEKIALLGANGSGKSTLLLVLAGLIFPKTGSVNFFGRTLTEESFTNPSFREFFRRKVGIVFQNSDIQLFNSNVEDEILFGLEQLGVPKDVMAVRLEKYLDIMSIRHLRNRHPQYLSIGEKKRVAITSVLAMEPEIILLDEPTSGLDPRTTRALLDTITRIGAEGRTIITTTQDIHIVAEIADRIIVMSENKGIARDGNAEDILNDRSFLGDHNLIHVHAHKHASTVHVHPHDHPSHDHPHS